MKDLIWSSPARRDLFAIAAYYGRLDPTLPALLLGRITHAPLVLLDYPALGSPTEKRGIRKWKVRATPFMLFYRPNAERIEILRVRHVAMDGQTDP